MPDLDRFLPLAYIGPGPGQEFIPYFFTLLGFVGAVLVAVAQWPVAVLLRGLRRARAGAGAGLREQCAAAQRAPESPGDAG